jgi:hypothetical protein
MVKTFAYNSAFSKKISDVEPVENYAYASVATPEADFSRTRVGK